MRRKVFAVAAGASAVLCVAACVLWARSHGPTDRASHAFGGQRYTARSVSGVLTLTGPPPLGPADDPRVAEAMVARIRNDRVLWSVYKGWSVDALPETQFVGAPGWDENPEFFNDPQLGGLWAGVGGPSVPPLAARVLLAAMEDPDRGIAAHLALHVMQYGFREADLNDGEWPAGEAPFGDLRLSYAPREDVVLSGPVADQPDQVPARVWATPAAVAAARDAWHDRLDVTITSAPWWAVAVATGVLPAGWATTAVARVLRGWRRRRSGCCPACGYDLRATPGRCPECGAAAGPGERQS